MNVAANSALGIFFNLVWSVASQSSSSSLLCDNKTRIVAKPLMGIKYIYIGGKNSSPELPGSHDPPLHWTTTTTTTMINKKISLRTAAVKLLDGIGSENFLPAGSFQNGSQWTMSLVEGGGEGEGI